MVNSVQGASLGAGRAWIVALGWCLSLAFSCVSAPVRAQGSDVTDRAAAKSDTAEPPEKPDAPETVEKLGASDTLTGQLKSEVRPEDAARSSAELVEQAHAALRDILLVNAEATVAPELESLAREMPKRRAELAERIAVAKESTRRSRRAVWVRDIRFSFAETIEQIELWQARVNEASTALTSARRRTTEILTFWRRVSELTRDAKVAPEVWRKTQEVVEAGQRAELALTRPESVIVPLQATLVEMRDMTTAFLAYAEREGPSLMKDARRHDFPIWRALGDVHTLVADSGTPKDPFARVGKTVRYMLQMGKLFWATSAEKLVAHGVLVFLTLLGLFGLRARARDWQGDQPEGQAARQVVAHPIAASLLLGAVASLPLYAAVPTIITLSLYVVAMGSALALFPHLLDPRVTRIGYVLCVFMTLDALRLFLIELVAPERLVLTAELVVISFLLVRILSPRRWRASPFAQTSPGLSRAVAGLWCAGASVGALAAIFGRGSVAEILGGGVLVSMYLALILTAAFRAASGTVWMLTQLQFLGGVNVVQKYRSRIVRSVSTLLRGGAFLLWAWLSLRYLTLSHGAGQMISSMLHASLEVGTLKISLGDLVFLALGAYLAVRVARIVRLVLDEDVVLRLQLSEGTAQVTSITAYYAMLLFGFGCTLAAAGIQLDRLTVLAGALGVGIGFGLQNVVQNFVAGLLLLFGGPIKIRDKIQVGDLTGEVLSIGFRSSTVRTPQGAEVIVPNSKLITDQVINWTMSDRKRRLELAISVEHGSDPRHVMRLLEEVGRSHAKVLADPPPQAMFLQRGGPLEFQLQVWVTFDDYASVRSDLTLALNERLADERVQMPSTSSDVNIVNVDDFVEKLRDATAKVPRSTA
ncbi:MAG TPA: mechanosensitive ion channel domain-containing protein [Polyangiaceae bacterium]|nr:mechanosensitive ion channel domain-containing protein [Polyangiaceae bacterium]